MRINNPDFEKDIPIFPEEMFKTKFNNKGKASIKANILRLIFLVFIIYNLILPLQDKS